MCPKCVLNVSCLLASSPQVGRSFLVINTNECVVWQQDSEYTCASCMSASRSDNESHGRLTDAKTLMQGIKQPCDGNTYAGGHLLTSRVFPRCVSVLANIGGCPPSCLAKTDATSAEALSDGGCHETYSCGSRWAER